jgi:hypothetical protein
MDIVTLLEVLVKSLNEAEEKFFENPKDFYTLETSVKSSTEAFAASYLGTVLSSINKQIYQDGWRRGKYTVQRNDKRTIISSVGDVTFDSTYYKSKENKGEYHYLTEEILGITAHERFTEAAEVAILTEALKTSYEEATKVIPSKSKITKTTVMNKVHGIANELPEEQAQSKKKVKYLFVEADEDHVAEQHGRWNDKNNNKNFISKLAYVYEYKKDSEKCKGRKELVNTFYFGGVYEESQGVKKFWEKVNQYIDNNYEAEKIEKIYISGDGAGWIKTGEEYVYKAIFCADKFHLMKYINKASNQMLDEKEIAKSEIYRLLYEKKQTELKRYLDSMMECASNPEPIEALETFVTRNWKAIMMCLHDEVLQGCSAESHVSHVLSDRLSSRPKGWSKKGADRMSKLRCYERNYGREKIIELVRYSREKRQIERTGTDGIEMKNIQLRTLIKERTKNSQKYIDRFQGMVPGMTAKKIFAIREQIKMI